MDLRKLDTVIRQGAALQDPLVGELEELEPLVVRVKSETYSQADPRLDWYGRGRTRRMPGTVAGGFAGTPGSPANSVSGISGNPVFRRRQIPRRLDESRRNRNACEQLSGKRSGGASGAGYATAQNNPPFSHDAEQHATCKGPGRETLPGGSFNGRTPYGGTGFPQGTPGGGSSFGGGAPTGSGGNLEHTSGEFGQNPGGGGYAPAGGVQSASSASGSGAPGMTGNSAGGASGGEAGSDSSGSDGSGGGGSQGDPGGMPSGSPSQGAQSGGGSPVASIMGNAGTGETHRRGRRGTGRRAASRPVDLPATATARSGDSSTKSVEHIAAARSKEKPKPVPVVKRRPLNLNRDWHIPLECRADGVTIMVTQQHFTLQEVAQVQDNPLLLAVRQMIDKRQARVPAGELPYRPLLRFQVKPDGLRSYYLAYPVLDYLNIPMMREDCEPESNIRADRNR